MNYYRFKAETLFMLSLLGLGIALILFGCGPSKSLEIIDKEAPYSQDVPYDIVTHFTNVYDVADSGAIDLNWTDVVVTSDDGKLTLTTTGTGEKKKTTYQYRAKKEITDSVRKQGTLHVEGKAKYRDTTAVTNGATTTEKFGYAFYGIIGLIGLIVAALVAKKFIPMP